MMTPPTMACGPACSPPGNPTPIDGTTWPMCPAAHACEPYGGECGGAAPTGTGAIGSPCTLDIQGEFSSVMQRRSLHSRSRADDGADPGFIGGYPHWRFAGALGRSVCARPQPVPLGTCPLEAQREQIATCSQATSPSRLQELHGQLGLSCCRGVQLPAGCVPQRRRHEHQWAMSAGRLQQMAGAWPSSSGYACVADVTDAGTFNLCEAVADAGTPDASSGTDVTTVPDAGASPDAAIDAGAPNS